MASGAAFHRAYRRATQQAFLEAHEEAFAYFGGVFRRLRYDNLAAAAKRVLRGSRREETARFIAFRSHWRFEAEFCTPARGKGKVESGVKYVRRNFLCGRTATSLEDLNDQLRAWVWETANQRVHGTTHQPVLESWTSEKAALQPLDSRPPYPLTDDEPRRVSRDAFVAWRSNRYSVPWPHAGAAVRLRERAGRLEVFRGPERIAVHEPAGGRHQIVRLNEHHADIPLAFAGPPGGKGRIHITVGVPEVEVRSLAAYESVAGGAR